MGVRTTKDETKLFAGTAAYMTLEKRVLIRNGKLSWAVDSKIELAMVSPDR